MEVVLKGMLEAVVKRTKPSPKWPVAFGKVLDTYLGASPEQFTYDSRTFTPQEFAASLDFRADDYVNITSYTHHPFYQDFVLEIPDNYSNGSFYNLPIEDVIEIINYAVENGYSVAWDGEGGGWARMALTGLQGGIAGGTNEIQRNIIGDRVLGLPRDIDVSKNVPFNELKVGTQRD